MQTENKKLWPGGSVFVWPSLLKWNTLRELDQFSHDTMLFLNSRGQLLYDLRNIWPVNLKDFQSYGTNFYFWSLESNVHIIRWKWAYNDESINTPAQ